MTALSSAAGPHVVGYMRVSTTLQVDTGASLETQRQKIQAYATFHDKPLRGIWADEGVSGKNIESRHQLRFALAALQPGDVFVVQDLSRFSRSTGDALAMLQQIQNGGCEFVSLTQAIDSTTPQGRLLFTMLAAFNALEREQTVQKVSDVMRRLSKDGLLGKRPPFGWEWVAKRQPFKRREDQQAVIERARALFLKDAQMTVHRAVSILNDDEDARKSQGGKAFFYRSTRQWLVDNSIMPESEKVKRRGAEQRGVLPPLEPAAAARS